MGRPRLRDLDPISDCTTNYYSVREVKELVQNFLTGSLGAVWLKEWTLREQSGATLAACSLDEILNEVQGLESKINDLLTRQPVKVEGVTPAQVAALS